jgi:hypothetical protein
LVGSTLGIGFTLLFALETVVSTSVTGVSPIVNFGYLFSNYSYLPGSSALSAWLFQLQQAVVVGLAMFFAFFLLRALLRRTWLAAVGSAAIMSVIFGFGAPANVRAISVVAGGLAILGGIGALVRFGVLPGVIAIFVSSILPAAPLTLNLSAWYASGMYFPIATVLGLALWSWRTALSGRRLLKDDLFDA